MLGDKRIMTDQLLELKLINMYSSLWAMEPPEAIIGIGKMIANAVYTIFKDLLGDDFHVAMGYYGKDLKADIGYLNSYRSRPTFFFNLYLTEFIADYFLYLEDGNDSVIHYFYGKQLRNFEFHSGNKELAAFYNKMYLDAKKNLGEISKEHITKAVIISIFVILHEWAHQNKELVTSMQAILNKQQEEGKLTFLTSEDMKEISCDCIALIMMESMENYEAIMPYEEILGVSSNLMILINLYRCFSDFTLDSINGGNRLLINKLHEVTNTLSRRATGLIALIALLRTQGDFFQDIDLYRTKHIFEATGALLDNFKRIINMNSNNDIKEFQMIPIEKKKEYYLSKPKNIWYYYL